MRPPITIAPPPQIPIPTPHLPGGDPFDNDLFALSPLHPKNRPLAEILLAIPSILLHPPADAGDLDGSSRCAGNCMLAEKQETPSAEELNGKSAKEIDDLLKGRGWPGEATKRGNGIRYSNPDRPSDQIRVMPHGSPGTSQPELHDDPYGIVSKDGARTRFKLR